MKGPSKWALVVALTCVCSPKLLEYLYYFLHSWGGKH